MIYLTCPQCSSELEIDDGFRGGVCRCFSCGTLMTVPESPEPVAAETRARPETPGDLMKSKSGSKSPPRRPAAPPPAPAKSPPQQGHRISADSKNRAMTASGRIIDLSMVQVPVARKSRRRTVVRASMIGVFSVIVLIMVGFIAYGFHHLTAAPPDIDAHSVNTDQFGYDPQVNPFLLKKPNFMGLPLAPRTVLMADGSGAMRNYFDGVKIAIQTTLPKLDAEQQVQVVLWRESVPFVFPAQLTPAKNTSQLLLNQKLDELFARGAISARPAFAVALQAKPDLLIMVAHFLPSSAEMKQVAQQVRNAGVRLDVVLLDNSDDDLKKLAQDTGGKYVEVSSGDLNRWVQQYAQQKN